MLTYPQVDPVIFQIGPLAVRWYGLMYIISFFCALFLCRYQLKEKNHTHLIPLLENVLFVSFLGLVVGARLGFCFFYYPDYFLKNPSEIIAIWKGGMSFHGGMLGAILAGYLYLKKYKQPFLWWADLVAVVAPLGLFFGRIGNFLNGELFGRPSTLPWAMIFPDGGPIPRHPVQLYEAIVTGLILFLIMWNLRNKPWAEGSKLAAFLILYGVLRFFSEFLREPAQSISLIHGWMTVGQLLCLGMIISGIVLIFYIKHSKSLRSQKFV